VFVIPEEKGPLEGAAEVLRFPVGDTGDGVTTTVNPMLVTLVTVLLTSERLVVRLVMISVAVVTGVTVPVVLG
jgi:hypothetical protein